MNVPAYIGDARVLYYVPLDEPESNGEDLPETVVYVLVESFMPLGSSARVRSEPAPTALFCIELGRNGEEIRDSWYDSEADFLKAAHEWGLPLLIPGDEIPSQGC